MRFRFVDTPIVKMKVRHVAQMVALPLLIEMAMRVTFMRLSAVVRIEVAKATLDFGKSDTWRGRQVCQNSLLGKVNADLGNECFQRGVGAVVRSRWRRLCGDGGRKQGQRKGNRAWSHCHGYFPSFVAGAFFGLTGLSSTVMVLTLKSFTHFSTLAGSKRPFPSTGKRIGCPAQTF